VRAAPGARGAHARQPTVRPIQRLTAGRSGRDFITVDSADSAALGLAAFAFAFGFAGGAVLADLPFAAAGAVFFAFFPAGAVFFAFFPAGVPAAGFTAFVAVFAAAFGAAFAAVFFAGALPVDFFFDIFFAPLAAMPVFSPSRAW